MKKVPGSLFLRGRGKERLQQPYLYMQIFGDNWEEVIN